MVSTQAISADTDPLTPLDRGQFVPDGYAIDLLPEALAREYRWAPLWCQLTQRVLYLAVEKTPHQQLQHRVLSVINQNLNSASQWKIVWVGMARPNIDWIIELIYDGSYRLETMTSQWRNTQHTRFSDEQWPVVRWLDILLNDAVHRRASDIHLLPSAESLTVLYRVDGQMALRTTLPIAFWPMVVARIKVLAQLDIAEHRLPQDGAFGRNIHQAYLPIRVATLPHQSSEKVTLRLLATEGDLLRLPDVFAQASHQRQVRAALQARRGLIVVAGATGSGKTTTLYACLREWQLSNMNIITLEDPIEVLLSQVCQCEIDTAIGFDFAHGLRAALRHDPDGLLVGEVRDRDSCQLALRAALTGHPVLTSVHAADAVGVFQRLLELGASPAALEETIQLVIVQRLLRRACRCSGDKSQCHLCRGSGYFQRIAAVDAYVPTEEFFTTLAAHGQKWVQPASLGWQVARKQATNRMHAAIRQLLNSGFIDQKEFDRAVHNKGGKDANLPCTSG